VVPDVKVLDFKRSELRERFDDLYRLLNPVSATPGAEPAVCRLEKPCAYPVGIGGRPA
jgi:hypothetical protein